LGAGYPQDIFVGGEPARGEKKGGIAVAGDLQGPVFLSSPEGASTSGRPEKISREAGKSAQEVASVGTSFPSTALRQGEREETCEGGGEFCFTTV